MESAGTQRPSMIPPNSTESHRFGDYELVTSIGHGGMGEVFLARDKTASPDDPPVAVKILLESVNKNQEAVTMFMDEAAIMTQIHHPNVLEVFAFGKEQGRYYLAMEYLQGQSLANCIEESKTRGQKLTYAQIAAIGIGMARGLGSAHTAVSRDGKPLNVVHRDVTPQNIFITHKGRVKVIDFGIAKASERLTQTMVGMYKGKAAYMAPEQIDMESPDARADIFAMGVCLWEMITQQRLFLRKTPVECLQAILLDEIPSPTELAGKKDALLDEVVFNALERPLDMRTQTAAEIESSLSSYLRVLTEEYEEIIIQELMKGLYEEKANEEASIISSAMHPINPHDPKLQKLKDISGIAPSLAPNSKQIMTIAGQADGRETMVLELAGVRDTMPCTPRQSIVDHLRRDRIESVHKAVHELSVQLPTKQEIPVQDVSKEAAPKQPSLEEQSSIAPIPSEFPSVRGNRSFIVAAVFVVIMLAAALGWYSTQEAPSSTSLEAVPLDLSNSPSK